MKVNTKDETYRKHLKDESDLWNNTAKDELKSHPPDYRYYRDSLPYKIYRDKFVNRMLKHIRSGDKVLELGSYNGWFTLEMARKGAHVDAHDIASKAISIAKNYYIKSREREHYRGTVRYYVTDLNNPSFPKNMYDTIVIRNVLHHIVNLEDLFMKIHNALKPRGKVLVDDAIPTGKREALIAGVFLLLLPTDIPYQQKLQRIFKKGNILKRTQDLMDAKDASPFESISGLESLDYIRKMFRIEHYSSYASFVGTLSAKIDVPLLIKYPTLKILNSIDNFLTRIKILRGTVYFLVAKKT